LRFVSADLAISWVAKRIKLAAHSILFFQPDVSIEYNGGSIPCEAEEAGEELNTLNS
jgi:hypothetical protein